MKQPWFGLPLAVTFLTGCAVAPSPNNSDVVPAILGEATSSFYPLCQTHARQSKGQRYRMARVEYDHPPPQTPKAIAIACAHGPRKQFEMHGDPQMGAELLRLVMGYWQARKDERSEYLGFSLSKEVNIYSASLFGRDLNRDLFFSSPVDDISIDVDSSYHWASKGCIEQGVACVYLEIHSNQSYGGHVDQYAFARSGDAWRLVAHEPFDIVILVD